MCLQPACDRRLCFVIKVRDGSARTKVKRKNAGRGGREGGREKKICLLPPHPFPSFSRLTSAQLSCGRISYYKSQKRTTQKTLSTQAYVFIIPEVSQTNRDCNQGGKEYRQLSWGLHKGVRCIIDYEQSPIFPQAQQSERNASGRENHPTSPLAFRSLHYPCGKMGDYSQSSCIRIPLSCYIQLLFSDITPAIG